MVANCNVVRYLSALICIQLVSLTHLYLISTDAPLDGSPTGSSIQQQQQQQQQQPGVAISPVQQEQHEKDQLKTREHLIAERNLLQAKLDQARRQLTVKDRKLRKIERQAATATGNGSDRHRADAGGDEENDEQRLPHQRVPSSDVKNDTGDMGQLLQTELFLLRQKNEEKDRKLKLAKEELKSTYSNFLVQVPQTTGESNNKNNNNFAAEIVEESFLLRHLQSHRARLRSTLTKYRVCHDPAPPSNAADYEIRTTGAGGGGTTEDTLTTRCWLHTVADSYFTLTHARRFVVIRNPLTHVPALYQQCRQQQQQQATTDSTVPSTLDQWLERDKSMTVTTKETPEGEVQEDDDDEGTDDDNPRRNAALRRQKKLKQPRQVPSLVDECQFRYAPVDPQTRRVLHGLPESLQNDSEFVLQNLYDTVGLTDELFRTACLFSISIHRRVPPQCDCSKGEFVVQTDKENDNDDGKNSNSNNNNNNNEEREDARTPKFDDSVPITQEQGKAIARITTQDQRLYDTAKQLFWEQVVRVEELYDFRMC